MTPVVMVTPVIMVPGTRCAGTGSHLKLPWMGIELSYCIGEKF